MEQCALCFRNVSKAELFSVSDCGKKTFECKDENVCREIADNARKNHALLIKTNRSLTFKEKYGVDITDLIELPRLRDASITIAYLHKNCGIMMERWKSTILLN